MARVEDVTDYLVEDSSSGPGDYTKRVRTTKGAKTLSPLLAEFFNKWRSPSDKTMGFVSKPLAYARAVSGGGPRVQANLIRLIKGGHVRVCKVLGHPPSGSAAHRDSPYADQFYLLRAGACPTEIEPGAATFSGARRRRR